MLVVEQHVTIRVFHSSRPFSPYTPACTQRPTPNQDDRDIDRASPVSNHSRSTVFCDNRAIRPHSAPIQRATHLTTHLVTIRKAHGHFDSSPESSAILPGLRPSHATTCDSASFRHAPDPALLQHLHPLQPLKRQSPAFSHVVLRWCAQSPASTPSCERPRLPDLFPCAPQEAQPL